MLTITCLALAAYHEAREHYREPDAMAAVVAVVMNRVEDERYADDACAVISADGQFPWYTSALPPATSGAPDAWAWLAAIEVAEEAVNGNGLDITSTHFHTVGKPQYWASEYEFDGVIGNHKFYTNVTPWR